MKITVFRGDLLEVRVDAIVNPANSQGSMGGGVAGAIKEAGGEEIEKEAMANAPIALGHAITTTAGRLRARFVIHAPTMEKPGERASEEAVHAATLAALREAESLKLHTIAFPGMGTGVGGLPYERAARAMVRAASDFFDEFEYPEIEEIIFVAKSEELARAFEKAISEL